MTDSMKQLNMGTHNEDELLFERNPCDENEGIKESERAESVGSLER